MTARPRISTQAETVFALVEMTEAGRAEASAVLDKLWPAGKTNLWDGMLAGLESLRAGAAGGGGGRQRALLLLTDGQVRTVSAMTRTPLAALRYR
jgi:Mg-chelatase subunit ChlD